MVNNKMYSEAVRMALKVDFLESKEDFNMYVNAIYEAMMWGMKESKKAIKTIEFQTLLLFLCIN